MKRSSKSLAGDPNNRSSSSQAVLARTPARGAPQSQSGGLAASERQKRARDRARKVHDTHSGFLRRARLRKEVTRQSYAGAWQSFMSFCVATSRLPGVTSRFVSMHQLDQSLEALAEDQFLSGASKYIFTCALQNANVEYPCWPTSSRANYPLSKSAKKGWGNLEPGASRDPCPFEVACLIAGDMLENEGAHFIAAVMLSFDTYLLPGKLCELEHSHVIPPTKVSSRFSDLHSGHSFSTFKNLKFP